MRQEVRRGNTQAQFNDQASTFLFAEIGVLSILIGVAFSSWWVFGFVFIGLIAMTWFRGSTLVLVITLTLCWLVAGFALGLIISGYGAAFVIGIIALLVSAGFHIAAIEWVEDMK